MIEDECLDISDWEEAGDKFALRVQGNAMIEEHIADGDFVVIQRQSKACSGQIVAVRNDEGEVTLRKLYLAANGTLRFEAGGGRSSVSRPADYPILGVCVGVVRKY